MTTNTTDRGRSQSYFPGFRIEDSGHYLAEEQPEEVLQEFLRFFRDEGTPISAIGKGKEFSS